MVFDFLLSDSHLYSGLCKQIYEPSRFRDFATIDFPLFLKRRGLEFRLNVLENGSKKYRRTLFRYPPVDFSIEYVLRKNFYCEIRLWAHNRQKQDYIDLWNFVFESMIDSEW